MKFINYIESISGVSIFGLASLLLFTGFFTLMFLWTIRADKHLMEEMERIPLDNESTD